MFCGLPVVTMALSNYYTVSGREKVGECTFIGQGGRRHKVGYKWGIFCLLRPWQGQTGMTNKWLKELGLIPVKDQWVKIHYPASAR